MVYIARSCHDKMAVAVGVRPGNRFWLVWVVLCELIDRENPSIDVVEFATIELRAPHCLLSAVNLNHYLKDAVEGESVDVWGGVFCYLFHATAPCRLRPMLRRLGTEVPDIPDCC